MEMISRLTSQGHRTLIFSQWPSLLKRVREDLSQAGYDSLYLDGQTKQPGALCTTKTGPRPARFPNQYKGRGHRSQSNGCGYRDSQDPWWNPAAEAKAMDRAYRIGQDRPVSVYRLIANQTVEERVIRTQDKKSELFASLFEESAP